ncbi:MAG: ribonuclease P protein component 1 [Hadesarchaea archaeon]|nr:ribonuclease P protein component 1 [Hadesarchaea archaeon]
MPLTRQNLLRHELIGLEAEVVESLDPSLKGKKGRIVDETKNMIYIEEMGKIKSLPKSIVVFRVSLPSGEEVMVDGKKIIARPEDRIKKCK